MVAHCCDGLTACNDPIGGQPGAGLMQCRVPTSLRPLIGKLLVPPLVRSVGR